VLASDGFACAVAGLSHLVVLALLAPGLPSDGGLARTLWFCGTALVLCTLWAQLLGRGPLERLLGAVSRWAARNWSERPTGPGLRRRRTGS
jgi:hypothetical protein